MALRTFVSLRHQSLRTTRVHPGDLVELDPDDPAWAPWLTGDRPSLIPAEPDGIEGTLVDLPVELDGTGDHLPPFSNVERTAPARRKATTSTEGDSATTTTS